MLRPPQADVASANAPSRDRHGPSSFLDHSRHVQMLLFPVQSMCAPKDQAEDVPVMASKTHAAPLTTCRNTKLLATASSATVGARLSTRLGEPSNEVGMAAHEGSPRLSQS